MSTAIDLAAVGALSEHGTRARYVSGCRCEECRAANRQRYHARQREIAERADEVEPSGPPITRTMMRGGRAHSIECCPGANGAPCVRSPATWLKGQRVCAPCVERATVWDGLVPAEPSRDHILKLRAQGVGYKSVAAASDISTARISDIIAGRTAKVRASTERRILDVDAGAIADHAVIDATRTNELVAAMRARGFTLRRLAELLGYQSPQLQVGRGPRVTAKTAARVDRLWGRIERGEVTARPHEDERQWLSLLIRSGVPQSWLSKRLGFRVTLGGSLTEPKAAAARSLRVELDELVREGVLPSAWQTPDEALRGIAIAFELPPSSLRSAT